jgi:hypothetical protein
MYHFPIVLLICSVSGHGLAINDADALFGWGWKDNPRRQEYLAAQEARLAAVEISDCALSNVEFALEIFDWKPQLTELMSKGLQKKEE